MVSGVPDAQPSDQTRFAYVDVAEMAAKLAPVPPDYKTAEACRVCGQTDWWVVVDASTERTPVMGETGAVVGHRYRQTAAKLVCTR
jgi:hypothetical protein